MFDTGGKGGVGKELFLILSLHQHVCGVTSGSQLPVMSAVPAWAFMGLHFSVLLKHRASFYHYSCLPLHAEAWIRHWGERLLDEKVGDRGMQCSEQAWHLPPL